jgi:LmbE family N-acetylglucosaminyl deacetylase
MLLSLTRGEGGANLISSNFFDELGVLRTLEHLAACERYGCELYYTRAADYGFSKTMEEALRSWGGEEEILRDAVRAIRTLRPDVVFARFRGDARDGHGHHMLSGVIAHKAFEAAADPSRFPEQIAEGLRPWAAKKLYHGNLNPDFRPEDRELVTLTVDPGTYDPVLGRSYHQLAREGYSYHRSQGMMSPPSTGGPRPSRYRLVESRLPGARPAKEESFFEGIDTSIGGLAKLAGEDPPPALVENLREVDRRVGEALAAFDARAPEKTVEPLSRGFVALLSCLIWHAGDSPDLRAHLKRKVVEFQRALTLALGLEVDARMKTGRGEPGGGRFDHAIPGQKFTAQITVTNRGKVPLRVFAARVAGPGDDPGPPEEVRWKTLGPNESVKEDQPVAVRPDAPPTRPHWTRGSIEEHLYRWVDPAFATRALPAEPFRAQLLVYVPYDDEKVHDTHFSISAPLRVAVEEPKRGVRMEPLAVVPAIGVRFPSAYGVVPAGKREYRLPVLVHSNEKGPARGTVRLKLPAGWRSEPESREFAFEKENEEGSSEFTLHLPEGSAAEPAAIEAVASYAGREYAEGYVTVTVPEVGRFNHYRPARHLVRVVEVTLPSDLRLAYVMGSGDEVPSALEALGVRVEMLGPAELASKSLSGYDAVVIGVRAYAVRPDLRTSNARLLEYVKAGGVLLVQYQTPEFDQDYGPYPYSMTSNPEEVSEEDSAVTILAPEHPVFRAPNRITPKDFEGWVEERGSKFWKTWDERYTPLLECHDHGQDPQKGGLLYARYGKGSYIYCAYAFYRQLPHGVPGAVRLWANLLSQK